MSAVRTWADGFGRWYAEVPARFGAIAAREAADAIGHELNIRGDRSPGHVVTVELVAADYGTSVYREVWAD